MASTSIPPAVAFSLIASAPVPAEERTSDESVAPVTLIVKSSPAPSVLRDIFEAVPLPSIENPRESIVVVTTSAEPI